MIQIIVVCEGIFFIEIKVGLGFINRGSNIRIFEDFERKQMIYLNQVREESLIKGIFLRRWVELREINIGW